MSWDSNIGILKNDDNKNFFNSFMHFFNDKSGKTSSYKFALVKCLLDNIFNFNENYEIDFAVLNATFAKIYWNLISKYHLPQITPNTRFTKTGIEKICEKMFEKNPSLDGVDFDVLNNVDKKNYIKDVYNIFIRYVIGALYSDLNGEIYGFDKDTKLLKINENVYNFIIQNKTILEKVNYYCWIIWMEDALKRHNLLCSNENYVNIGTKLDESTKREVLTKFKIDLLSKGEELKCFYCGNKVTKNGCHIDHFIPWKFVKDDQIWNLVISCSHCNESKKDRIPSKELLNKLIRRNEKIFGVTFEDKLDKLWKSALYNGFNMW